MKVKLIITRKVLFEKYSLKEDINGFLLSFLDECEIKFIHKIQDAIFYVKHDVIIFRQDLYNGIFWISYDLIWSVFEKKYKLEYEQIQDFIKILLVNNLKSYNCDRKNFDIISKPSNFLGDKQFLITYDIELGIYKENSIIWS